MLTLKRFTTKCALKWKLFCTFVVLIIVVAIGISCRMKSSFRKYVHDNEIKRFRNSVLAALRKECKEYFTSRDKEKILRIIRQQMYSNQDISYIFFVDVLDADKKIISSFNDKPPEPIYQLMKKDKNREKTGSNQNIKIGGKRIIDITAKTLTKPSYLIHLGFQKSLVNKKCGGIFTEITIVTIIMAVVTAIVAFALMIIFTHPLEKLANDAERLSMGDMNVKLAPKAKGEVRIIHNSLARLKESIVYSIRKLDGR